MSRDGSGMGLSVDCEVPVPSRVVSSKLVATSDFTKAGGYLRRTSCWRVVIHSCHAPGNRG